MPKKLTKDQVKEARRDLDKLLGRGEFSTPSNLCYGDGYFARSLEQKYGMSVSDLQKTVG